MKAEEFELVTIYGETWEVREEKPGMYLCENEECREWADFILRIPDSGGALRFYCKGCLAYMTDIHP